MSEEEAEQAAGGLQNRDVESGVVGGDRHVDDRTNRHMSSTQPVTTRGLLDPLPELRMSRKATAASNTGSTTLIRPSTPAAMA